MSAGKDIHVDLPSVDLPRRLKITWGETQVRAVLSSADDTKMLVFAGVERLEGANLRLENTHKDYVLWVGSAAFDLSEREFKLISDFLGPLGLEVRTVGKPR